MLIPAGVVDCLYEALYHRISITLGDASLSLGMTSHWVTSGGKVGDLPSKSPTFPPIPSSIKRVIPNEVRDLQEVTQKFLTLSPIRIRTVSRGLLLDYDNIILYPNPCTVRMIFGLFASASIFWRSFSIKLSTVRVFIS